MYEHSSEPLAERAVLIRRLLNSTFLGTGAIGVSLVVGMVGFKGFEHLSWIDAFLNTAMLLGGEGPIDHERGVAGKLFEGVYAIYSGLAVITIAGIIFAPLVHRFFHRLHRHYHVEELHHRRDR